MSDSRNLYACPECRNVYKASPYGEPPKECLLCGAEPDPMMWKEVRYE